jgi:cell division protein FtsI (penicillin-binding protein 3)
MTLKVKFTFFILLVAFSSVIIKAFYLQVINRDKLITYSNQQVLRQTTSYPKRGYIYDRNGSPLAVNVTRYNLFSIPKNFKELKKELRSLSKIIPQLDSRKLYRQIKKRSKYTWISRKVELSDEQVEKIKKFKQVFIEKQYSRFYPNNELAAQVLGFVGIDNDGLSGVEYSFNSQLKGNKLIQKYYKDAKGRPVKFTSKLFDKSSDDLYLSIDKDIQSKVEQVLQEVLEKHKALKVGAAVMDVSSGEILALANLPSFDPNNYGKYPSKQRKLSFVTDPFEPGSIFKSFTIAAALENNIVQSDTNFYCEEGKMRVQNHYITESDPDHKFEWLSVKDILGYSSNVGTTKIAFDIGYPTLKKFLKTLRLNEKTNLQIPGESRGIFDDREDVPALRLSNISFGQGIATTAIQVMAAYAPFANKGIYVEPTLIKDDKNNKHLRVMSTHTAEEMTNMLTHVVDNGTGSTAAVEYFKIAGKTSTAQKIDSNGGYKGYIGGFLGYPVDIKDKFLVYVYVDEPTENGYYGSVVAAPAFKKIVKNILYKRKEYNRLARINNNENIKSDWVNIKVAKSKRSAS